MHNNTHFNFLSLCFCIAFRFCQLFFIQSFNVGFDVIRQARVVCGQKGSQGTGITVLSIRTALTSL